MSNNNPIMGFSPVNPKCKVKMCYKSAAVQLGVGDPVVYTADSSDPLGYPSVTRMSTGSYGSGVVTEVLPLSTRTYPYLKSGDSGYVMIAYRPEEEFYVRDNGGATGMSVQDIGNSINAVSAIDCNTTTGLSNYQIDTEAKGNGNSFYISGVDHTVNNDATSANAIWKVQFNLHTGANNAATNIKEI